MPLAEPTSPPASAGHSSHSRHTGSRGNRASPSTRGCLRARVRAAGPACGMTLQLPGDEAGNPEEMLQPVSGSRHGGESNPSSWAPTLPWDPRQRLSPRDQPLVHGFCQKRVPSWAGAQAPGRNRDHGPSCHTNCHPRACHPHPRQTQLRILWMQWWGRGVVTQAQVKVNRKPRWPLRRVGDKRACGSWRGQGGGPSRSPGLVSHSHPEPPCCPGRPPCPACRQGAEEEPGSHLAGTGLVWEDKHVLDTMLVTAP